jgi:hypothetical protein
MSDETLEMFKDVLGALKELASAVEQIEARVRILEK